MNVISRSKRAVNLKITAISTYFRTKFPDVTRKQLIPVSLIIFSFVCLLFFIVIKHHAAKPSTTGSSNTKSSTANTNKPKTDQPSSSSKNNTTSPPKPAPKPAVVAPAPVVPASLLSLANWKLALPIDTPQPGRPDEISQPALASFTSPYFQVNAQKNGVVFQAPVEGVTTTNSDYPRSELREMIGGQSASWSNSSGTHSMTIREAITHLPAAKPHVVAGQIHDASDDVIMIRLEGSNLFVQGDGKTIGSLDPNYQLGTVFTVQVVASNGHIRVSYNGSEKVDYVKSGSGYYFKAGCYTQSNLSKGDAAGAYGEVVIYSLAVSHS